MTNPYFYISNESNKFFSEEVKGELSIPSFFSLKDDEETT